MDAKQFNLMLFMMQIIKYLQIQRNRKMIRNFILSGQLSQSVWVLYTLNFNYLLLFQMQFKICYHFRAIRNHIAKVRNFYEETVPQMTPRYFRRYFRMYKEGLQSLINYLAPSRTLTLLRDNARVPLEKQIAMTTAYLGTKSTTLT